MTQKNTLQDLSRSLNTEEREDLFQRITSALSLESQDTMPVVPDSGNKTDRLRRIRMDIQRSGLLTQFQLWISSLFSARSIEDRFIRLRRQQILRKIRKTNPDLLAANGEYVGGDLARETNEIYRTAEKLKALFTEMWDDTLEIAEIAAQLTSVHIPSPKTSLFDFVDVDTLRSDFLTHRSADATRQIIREALQEYLLNIHPKAYELVADELAPLYNLRPIVLFPYQEFLRNFVIQEGFHGARFSAIKDILEKLYYAVYVAVRNPGQVSLQICRDNRETAAAMEKLTEQAQDFFNRVPLAELIKAGRQDPYYRFMVYVPRIDVKRFLSTYLNITLMQQFDHFMPSIRADAVSEKVKRLFPDSRVQPYKNLTILQHKSNAGSVLPIIHRAYVLALYDHYVTKIFSRKHEPTAVTISRSQTRRIRQTSNDILLILSNIDDTHNRIERLNASLETSAAEGEEITKLRELFNNDPGAQRLYRAKISQLDKSCHELSLKAIDNLVSLRGQFAEHSGDLGPNSARLKKILEHEARWLDSCIDMLQLVAAVEDENPQDILDTAARVMQQS